MPAGTTNRIGIDITKTQTPASGSGTTTDITNLDWSPGTVVDRGDGRKFRWVMAEDADLVVGDVVTFTTADDLFEVTRDRVGGAAELTRPAGLAVTAIVDGDFGWIQVTGLNLSTITTDGSVAAGETIKTHATTDGGVDTFADGTDGPHLVVGQALADDATNDLVAGTVVLSCPTIEHSA